MPTLFLVCNYAILPFWALLILLPHWKGTHVLVPVVALALAPVYAFLILGDHPGGDFFTLDGVMRIFTSPRAVVAGWIHYLVADLFVGAWEARDARRLGVRHAFVVPSLVLTLMFGPLGLASWLVLRIVLRRRITLVEA